MTKNFEQRLDTYLNAADSWQNDRIRDERRMLKIAWMVAALMAVIALAEAFALAMLSPLKRVEPYTLLVDKQTGYVEALKPLEQQTITPDAALTRSLVAQYVLTRENFDINTLQQDYRKVALWSSGEARDRYVASMQATNPQSPLARMPRRALVSVEIRGISSLSSTTSLVRFATTRVDQGAQQSPQLWQAVVSYRFSTKPMSVDDRLINPLGFEVTRYRRDAELSPDTGTVGPVQPSDPALRFDDPSRAGPRPAPVPTPQPGTSPSASSAQGTR